MNGKATGGFGILFVIAVVLGVLKLTGHVTMSWWWIALIWPLGGLIVLAAIGVLLGIVMLVRLSITRRR